MGKLTVEGGSMLDRAVRALTDCQFSVFDMFACRRPLCQHADNTTGLLQLLTTYSYCYSYQQQQEQQQQQQQHQQQQQQQQ
ncbi:hypothetical protein T01_9255 [Trichinella spiralis]|uniref:Uncharacterized protein n=1 Tax=Trichinella spiralis TaxID=6334 RepID=A0A0V1AW10_TRISP|nr:hypothetical protein T01_9255 [Trichinella spiralis]